MKAVVVSGEIQGVPDEFNIFPFGRIEYYGGEVAYLNSKDMAAIISDFQSKGNDMVVDYEHQSLKDGPAPAAGWIKRLFNRGADGLWASVEWTRKAKAFLSNREYRYFSPVFMVKKADGHIIRLVNVALTNMPKTNHIRPIVAKTGSLAGGGTARTFVITKEHQYVCDLMGTSVDDVLKYGMEDTKHPTAEVGRNLVVTKELLTICELFGNSVDDVLKFGFGGGEHQ